MPTSRSILLLAATLLIPIAVRGSIGGEIPDRSIAVGPTGEFLTLSAAVAAASPGDRITVMPGIYREETLVIDKRLTLVGKPGAILDGEGKRMLIHVRADSVTISDLTFRNIGVSFVEDRAAIRVEDAAYCSITNNTFTGTFFGIYLAKSSDCSVSGNDITGSDLSESRSGNGIHLWYCKNIAISNNVIRRQRDGIYLEFVEDSTVDDNLSIGNKRYGLHFMFSDRCAYRNNTFRQNDAGVAVMYTDDVEMTGNRFEDNWGGASYGLLLKDINDSEIRANRFVRNTVGMYIEGSNRISVSENDFSQNGWAIKIMANAVDNAFASNNFVANSFDVATNSRSTNSFFSGNYWDNYQGYDLDRDGIGDVPFRPVRLFSLLVEQNEPNLILLRSFFVSLLDIAERILPVLTPDMLVDPAPKMNPNEWSNFTT